MDEQPIEEGPAEAPESPSTELREHPDGPGTQHAALERQLSELQTALEEERSLRAQRDGALSELRQQLSSAAQSYRSAVLAAAPELPPELVSGATPEEIDRSLAAAQEIVAAVKSRIAGADGAQPPPAVTVPAGAPVRAAPDLSALSALDKIKYALGR